MKCLVIATVLFSLLLPPGISQRAFAQEDQAAAPAAPRRGPFRGAMVPKVQGKTDAPPPPPRINRAAPGVPTPPPAAAPTTAPRAPVKAVKPAPAAKTGAKAAPVAKAGPATVTPPPGAPVPPATPGAVEVPGEKEFNSCKKLPPGKRIVRLNLKPDTEVMDLIGWISSITCTQFLIGVPVNGKKVTIIAPQLISAEEAYRLFISALDSVGLTVESTGRFLRVVENSKARFTPLPIIGPNQKTPADRRFVTKLVRVQYVDAAELTNNVLNRVKGETGDIVAYRSSLIITDQSDNIDRMLEIVKMFDSPSNIRDKIWVVRVKNMSAIDMASRIAEIMPVAQLGTGQRRQGAPPPTARPQLGPPGELTSEMSITKLIPDDRTNNLIVVANERAHDWLMAIIKKLDVPLADAGRGSEGRFHVYYCSNANCDELAATLAAVTGVQISGSLATGRRSRSGAAPAAPPAAAANAQGSLLFESDVRVTFDAPTNSLLIMATFKDYQSLRRVIEQLDAPRKQVYIEATIMEVLVSKQRDVGVGYHGGKQVGTPVDGSLALGGFNAANTMNPAGLVNNLGGLTAALFGPTAGDLANSTIFRNMNLNIPSFGAFLQLLQSNSDVNILSNPHILIMNNTEGEISVGEVLPFPGQTTAAMGAAANGGMSYMPFTSVQRQPVELKLKLSPSVNEQNLIRLDVEQEISDVTSKNYNNMGPATSKRTTKTTVVARDQQTVVIGGLMADRIEETSTKIPILGDIPVLGFFFRTTSKVMKKTNIIIAITPYVVNDLNDLRLVADRKLRERREFIDKYSTIEDNRKIGGNENYRRKRGMLEEINRTAREMEEDERRLGLIRDMEHQDENTLLEPSAGMRVMNVEEEKPLVESAPGDKPGIPPAHEPKTVVPPPEPAPFIPKGGE